MSKQRSPRGSLAKRRSVRKYPLKSTLDAQTGAWSSSERERDYASFARALVLGAWPAIVQGLIEKARNGGYQHTKLLLELCGLSGADAFHMNDNKREQLCDALLEGLENSFGNSPCLICRTEEPVKQNDAVNE